MKLDLNKPQMSTSSSTLSTPNTVCHTPNKKLISSSSKHSNLNLSIAHSETIENGSASIPRRQNINSQLHSILKHNSDGKMVSEMQSNATTQMLTTLGKIKSDKKKDPHSHNQHPTKSVEMNTKFNEERRNEFEKNPALPPKMHKSLNKTNASQSYYSNSKIHTITRPSESSPFSILPTSPGIKNSSSTLFRMSFPNDTINPMNHYTKTLPRVSAYEQMSMMAPNAPTRYNASATFSNNTLPKNSSSKHRTTTISDVVNKVPSIINIPEPLPVLLHDKSTDSIIVPPKICHEKHEATKNLLNNDCNTQTRKTNIQRSKDTAATNCSMSANSNNRPVDKPLPILTTSKNCNNPKEHFLPNDTSLDDDYLSECENCKSAHGSRYYLEEETGMFIFILEQYRLTCY